MTAVTIGRNQRMSNNTMRQYYGGRKETEVPWSNLSNATDEDGGGGGVHHRKTMIVEIATPGVALCNENPVVCM